MDLITPDAAGLVALTGTPTLLALGEPTHGSEVLLAVRNELFRELVERYGYRTIALESDCLAGLLVDDFVTGGDGEPDEVARQGISHGWGDLEGNRALIRWMREFNTGRPPVDQLHFAGFDGPLEMAAAQSPGPSLTTLLEFLVQHLGPELMPCSATELDELVGADDLWTEPAAMRESARSHGRTPAALQLRVVADELSALLAAHAPGLRTRTGWDRAHLRARTALGLLRYHHAMADRSAARVTRMVGERDAMMAANLLALAERGPTLVHAHNAHLQRDLSSMRFGGRVVQWWSAGALASDRLVDDYRFVATTLGTFEPQVAEEPEAGTIEATLQEAGAGTQLADPARFDPAALRRRDSPWFGYASLDPAQLSQLDGILHVDRA